MADVSTTIARTFEEECQHIVSCGQQFAADVPALAGEVAHIDNEPGAAIYIRNANQIARHLLVGASVLDWGCGFGQMAYLLANRGYTVSACDWGARPSLPGLADSRIDYFSLKHPTKIDVPDQSFDAVVSSGTLEHAHHILNSMEELRRILKPGGWVFVFRFPNELSISEYVARKSGKWAHSVRMSKHELRFMLRLFSFRVVELGYDTFLPVFLGHRLQHLRPLRAKYDPQMTVLDRVLTSIPLVSLLSTSIYCFAQLNTEYRAEAEG